MLSTVTPKGQVTIPKAIRDLLHIEPNDKVDFAVRQADRRPGDAAEIVAKADMARSLLDWQPQHDDLDTIVRHALAWERHLSSRNLE